MTEIQYLTDNPMDFGQLSKYFKTLSEDKGAEYAFEVLKKAKLPANIDMHLLGHVVGDELFKQKGLEGIKICTHDFRNACSHSIVVGLFFQEGDSALEKIAEACRQAPGGKGAYTMCFHGLGHGILAYTGYDMEKTIDLCQKTGTQQNGNREYVECVGGSVMEIVGGGFHDQELYAQKAPTYFRKDDPLYPCTATFMPSDVKPLCLNYLTPKLFEVIGSNLWSAKDDEIKKAFTACDRLPKDDLVGRDGCYGGFGKEFPTLMADLDVNKVDELSDEKLKRVYDLCLLADSREGSAACMVHALNSLYWGGENDRGVSISYCNQMDNDYFQKSCFMALISAVYAYIDDRSYLNEFCSELPVGYDIECRQRLSG